MTMLTNKIPIHMDGTPLVIAFAVTMFLFIVAILFVVTMFLFIVAILIDKYCGKKTCSTCRHFTPDNNAGEFWCKRKEDEISEPDEDSCDKWEGR